jgi:hypothetical protein
MVYTVRFERWGILAACSSDDGATWQTFPGNLIAGYPKDTDMGVPMTVQGPDGQLLVMYYVSHQTGTVPPRESGLHCHQLLLSPPG